MTKNIQMNSNYYQLLSEKYEQQLSNKYIIYTEIMRFPSFLKTSRL